MVEAGSMSLRDRIALLTSCQKVIVAISGNFVAGGGGEAYLEPQRCTAPGCSAECVGVTSNRRVGVITRGTCKAESLGLLDNIIASQSQLE
ncbi:MAG: hypothetical protein ACD_57C00350G0005 [uncultured bacterium]|uniref:Uncharacterized protein n=1 Tax=Candidatus Woesebacteria bacterium RIFCSPHIGHO2_12_FULL_41_24 TaxID=1802510 RepID=A0A1F8ATA0_9BACT|nr:MAG: hypothetical protein ACD_57C00350G0005 [uncultured bacterium]OGM14801.1 MAG: hypothetical protein A2W15_00485 [Candidatus Woesebacteria bacterium RBG_16_41_13]OGM30294.1 MAG: hypothetical protein A2873_05190 [Candidatus Woesebacteria bacterium RIFCSPHIGHO2_01_FULL_42_80]OGM34333.1 MAG: hypothetical protein A3D84_04775 [Candidatus Woesebacteria bacterium RIFCSPHIGHO2_02_FULL_42_20]OGM54984.1 MAG: hypothetical protein A3E44_05045 [Candidatus Woesebacteria bacterium RIFCSPHIGHO2_12_FULL_41